MGNGREPRLELRGNTQCFIGYFVGYLDGRVVQFNKPSAKDPPGTPGTYTTAAGIFDRFVVLASGGAQLFLSDGSVVNFSSVGKILASSVVDPYGLAVTMSYDASGETITEPGRRWIRISPTQGAGTNDEITTVTSSLGQSVTYEMQYDTPSSDGIKTTLGTVTYNDVKDPATNLPLQANYVYKWVQPPVLGPTVPPPPPFYRLEWASDPMFDGPLQQIKFVYTAALEGPNNLRGDPAMNAIYEEHWATDYTQAGVMVNRFEMGPNPTYDTTNGYSEDYWTCIQTRGDGSVRTISYFNKTTVA